MTDLPFAHIGIYGVGLLGGSLGLALKARKPGVRILGIGRNAARLTRARERGAIDGFTCDARACDEKLDLLVLCTPVRLLHQHFEESMTLLGPSSVVTDVGSTKADVVSRCEAIAQGQCAFVGSHPMAGSHETGVEAATEHLFENRVCVVTPTEQTDPAALQSIQTLWKLIGMRVVSVGPGEHDRLTARSSHLPHLAAAALIHAAMNEKQNLRPLIGSGFRDTTRIAAGDPQLWVDICLDNREELIAAMQGFQAEIGQFLDALQKQDSEQLAALLKQAQDWRKSIDEPSAEPTP